MKMEFYHWGVLGAGLSAYTAGNRVGRAGYDYGVRGDGKQAMRLVGPLEKTVYDGEERQAVYCYGIAAEGVRRVLNSYLYCVSQGGGNDDRLKHHRD